MMRWHLLTVREVYHSASSKLDVMGQGMQRRAVRGYGDCVASDEEDTRSIAEALRKTSQPLTQRTQLCTEAGTGFSQHLTWSLQQKECTGDRFPATRCFYSVIMNTGRVVAGDSSLIGGLLRK
ncbi:hypothetical protein O3P69_016154 [Scylla paramamosain]|uniref:Uncharacterized protein n=1 Tax=Scylla paramamosain TaxID=85552 RepID=A0AAW0SEL0_SCYPA